MKTTRTTTTTTQQLHQHLVCDQETTKTTTTTTTTTHGRHHVDPLPLDPVAGARTVHDIIRLQVDGAIASARFFWRMRTKDRQR